LIRVRRYLSALVFSLSALQALVACAPLVPAKFPPHIRSTPGAFVVVTDKQFDAGSFRLEFPRSWHVVKLSLADAKQLHVIFVAPDGGTVDVLQVYPVGQPSDEYITLPGGEIIRVLVDPAAEPSPDFLAQAEELVASIRN